MKRIISSLVIVFALVASGSLTTMAYFTDDAVIPGNTFATGVLEIAPGTPTTWDDVDLAGNMAPGDSVTKTFFVINDGAPYFGGPSTLDAGGMYYSLPMASGDVALYDAAWVKVERINPSGPVTLYDGWLKDMGTQMDAQDLPTGWTAEIDVTITIPASATGIAGLSSTFDFVAEGTTEDL